MTDEQELLCFIDWLGLSLHMNGEPRPLQGYIWKEYSATNVWSKRRVLWTEEGDRVLTLLSEPRSSILESKSALLEVENEWLYHGGGVEKILSTLLKSVPFEIMGISRLDLCCDFVPTEKQRDIIMGLAQDRYYVSGKRSGSGFWSTNKAKCLHPDWLGKKIPHSQSWGHKTSDVKWKLYYKTRELWEAGGWQFPHKPYIIDQWRMAGMDTSNVWRLEVSCKHLNGLQLCGETFDLRQLALNRAKFFADFFLQRFLVRQNDGHKDRTNDKVVDFLPMPNLGKNISKTPSKRLAEHSGRITLLRHLVQSLDDEHILLDEPSRYAVFGHINQILERDHLENYFQAMTGMWPDDFYSKKDAEAIEEFDSRARDGNVLCMENKGSSASKRLYDMPEWRVKSQFSPNVEFEGRQGESLLWKDSGALKQDKQRMNEWAISLNNTIPRANPNPQTTIQFEPPSE